MMSAYSVNAQQFINLNFDPVWADKSVKLDQNYPIDVKDSIRFDQLKWYISGITLTSNNKIVFEEENSFHLLDLSIAQSLSISSSIPKDLLYDHIQFSIGIDSLTNVAGAIGGDLDPTNGMYWTWQSGYINVKVEGKSNICPTRKNLFTFHLGGYTSPYQSIQKVVLAVKKGTLQHNILLNLDKFIDQVELVSTHHIMSPSDSAVTLSKIFASCFTINSEQ